MELQLSKVPSAIDVSYADSFLIALNQDVRIGANRPTTFYGRFSIGARKTTDLKCGNAEVKAKIFPIHRFPLSHVRASAPLQHFSRCVDAIHEVAPARLRRASRSSSTKREPSSEMRSLRE